MLCTAMGTAAYIVCCVLPLILYAVDCHMFVPWALPLILYAVYCRMFVPWALPLILYAVYCRMFVPWALPPILYAACLCLGHCCLYCVLCTATCLCHWYCTVSKLLAVVVLPHIIRRTYTATWFPPMGITAVHEILCNAWRITHVLSHDSLL